MVDETHRSKGEYEPLSLRDLVGSLRRQSAAIALSMAVILLLIVLGLVAIYILSPSERLASLNFRLEFQGAEGREYPSGVPFSTADIVAGPILRSVYQTNSLDRFLSFEEFSESVFVVEQNEVLQKLASEYRAKLADPKLSAVDRERLEREYEQKMESTARNSYSVSFASDVAGVQIPGRLLEKVLRDILQTWSEYAFEEKGAVRYQLPVLSVNILPSVDEEPIVALDMLRSRILDILRNIQLLRTIPGIEALRTSDGLTLAELEVKLDDVIRLYIRPLVNEFRSGRYVQDKQSAIRFLESQLDHATIRRDHAAARVSALKEALALYTEGSRPIAVSTQQPGGETVMPQFGDSFLDRIVDLAGQSADRQYRQNLVNEISEASLDMIPFETEIVFYEDLLKDLRSSAPSSGPAEAQRPQRNIATARSQVVTALEKANEIYELASENLNASRTLYAITGPVQFNISRSISPARLMLIGILLLMIAVPTVMAFTIMLDRLRGGDEVSTDR